MLSQPIVSSVNGGVRSKKNTNDLQDFLDTNLSDSNAEIERLQHLKNQVEKMGKSNKDLLEGCVQRRIDVLRQIQVEQMRAEVSQLQQGLLNKQKAFDAQIMNSILNYAAAMRDDMLAAQKQLAQEKTDKEALKKQAKVCRDLLMFSCHAQRESRSSVELTCLTQSSGQFVRCVKAVHDNLNDHFGDLTGKEKVTPEDVRILNVFKLKNTFLSKQLHAVTKKSPQAKVKGLFCAIPAEHIFSFTVHGLSVQYLPAIPPHSLQNLSDVFRPTWTSLSDSPLLPLSPELAQLQRLSAAAIKLSSKRGVGPVLRFGKYSTLSSIALLSTEEREQGVFLSLCRVLIVKQMNVETEISDSDFVKAAHGGYDAIYSRVTEEYVLLQPSNVLPEFFIHTFFRIVPTLKGQVPHVDENRSEREREEAYPAMLSPASASFPADSVSSLLLSNEVYKDSTKPTTEDGVKRKQNSLQQIEVAIEHFQRDKAELIMSMVKRLREMVNLKKS